MKIKIDAADAAFSQFIRLRDKKCKRCGSPVQFNAKGDPMSHQASHFQSRRKESTRFDEENVDCLCGGCHFYFTTNPDKHLEWQIETKGQKAVDMIILRSNQYMKRDRQMAKLYWRERYKQLKENI